PPLEPIHTPDVEQSPGCPVALATSALFGLFGERGGAKSRAEWQVPYSVRGKIVPQILLTHMAGKSEDTLVAPPQLEAGALGAVQACQGEGVPAAAAPGVVAEQTAPPEAALARP